MADVPPACQCTLPDCTREAITSSTRGGLCEAHHGERAVDPDNDGEKSETDLEDETATETGSQPDGKTALADAIQWFHEQIDRSIPDHTENDEHSERPSTAREYWQNVRGWTHETVREKQLGWAPANASDSLVEYLHRQGHNREDILATGLFTEDLRLLWNGRYVFPYFNEDDNVVYAISRTTGRKGGGAAGYDGHPEDFMAGKYAKPAHTKEYVTVDEPIYGLETIAPGEPILITEGIADAITAHQAGYSCLSPVTTTFKHHHRKALLSILEGRDVGRIYLIQDAERPTTEFNGDATGWDSLSIKQYGEGLRGAVSTAEFLSQSDLEVYLAELPRLGLDKVDLDDYLRQWADDLSPVLATAHPAAQHPSFEGQTVALETARREAEQAERAVNRRNTATQQANSSTEGTTSSLFSLSITDIVDVPPTYRGVNPLGHHGNSENYYVILDDGTLGFDHKYKVAYTALTHLLVEAGERPASAPNGALDGSELFTAWAHAKRAGYLEVDDPIPHRALQYLALDADLCDQDDLTDGWQFPAEAYNRALAVVQDEHELNPGRDPIADIGTAAIGGHETVIETSCPEFDLEAFDPVDRWDTMQGKRFDSWLDADTPVVWADDPGTGKTTNATYAAAERGIPFATLFDKHAKAHEFRRDPDTPDVDLQLKGAGQPIHDCCMDAVLTASEEETPSCSTHGRPSEWPRMHPVYDLGPEHPVRKRFEGIEQWAGTRRATFALKDELNEVIGEDVVNSPWFTQFDELESAERVVGVHEYATLETLRKAVDGNVIIDERLRAGDKHLIDVHTLITTANALDVFADRQPETEIGCRLASNAREFAQFARTCTDAIATVEYTDAPDAETGLASLDPPGIEEITQREYRGTNFQHYRKCPSLAESLAELKVAFGDVVLRRLQDGEWTNVAASLNPLFAAADIAGLDRHAVTRAISVPLTLDICPRCGHDTAPANGGYVCEKCGWHEASDPLTTEDTEPARATIRLAPHDEVLVYRELPCPDDLPETPLLLDATAKPERIAGQLDCPVETITVQGDDPLAIPHVDVTQVMDGQYHSSTIEDSSRGRTRIQQSIDTCGTLHEQPLFIVKKDLIRLFDFPENSEVIHYGGLRGLNFNECDAAMCIGAPHPNVAALRHEAELLGIHRDDLHVGGDEYSTRRDEEGTLASNPPAYRKLVYENDYERGRAVATKAYTGLVGTLFDEEHAGEIEQAVHRIRPLLADSDTPKNIYLLTNVPTEVPVDRIATFDELVAPLRAFLPVSERALSLLKAIGDVADGEGPDGFRPESLLERRADNTVTFNKRSATRLARLVGLRNRQGEPLSYKSVSDYVNTLTDLGLLTAGSYEQRSGVRFSADWATLKQALQIVSSNAGFKVAAVRRFRRVVEAANGSMDWLDWAYEVFALTGTYEKWGDDDLPHG